MSKLINEANVENNQLRQENVVLNERLNNHGSILSDLDTKLKTSEEEKASLLTAIRLLQTNIRDLTILGRQHDGDGQNELLQINGSKESSSYIINRMNLNNQFKQSYKLRLINGVICSDILEDSICPRVFSICQRICVTAINPYKVRTRSKW